MVLPRAVLSLFLRRAVSRGDPAKVAALLRRGADPEARDRQGFTCLMVAANRGDVRLMDTLLSGGCAVDTTSTVGGRWSGFTALMAACCDSTGAVAPVIRLLAAGADPTRVDNVGRNALDYALISGFHETARHLRARGVRPGGEAST